MDKILDLVELYKNTEREKIVEFNNEIFSEITVKEENNKNEETNQNWIKKMEETMDNVRAILETVDKYKENSYENKFIYSLINKMVTTIKNEKKKILAKTKIPIEKINTLEYQGKSYNKDTKVDVKIILTNKTEESELTVEDIEILKKIIDLEKQTIKLTTLEKYKELEKQEIETIEEKIEGNEVILNNSDFKLPIELWNYITEEIEKKPKAKKSNKVKENRNTKMLKKYMDELFLLDYVVLQNIEEKEDKPSYKNEIIEQLVSNMIEKVLDMDLELPEKQLTDLVSKKYETIKYKKQVCNKQIQDIFKKYISKYVQKITNA